MYSKTYRGDTPKIPVTKYDGRLNAKVSMKRAYDRVQVGKQYFLPMPHLLRKEDTGDVHRVCTCVEKHDHFAVFRTPKGYNVSFLWSELGGLLNERLCSE